jgi:hypothetical protein
MPDPYASWFAGPYGRQLRRQVLDFLRSDPHGVLDTAQRILSGIDEDAVRHLSQHVSEAEDARQQAIHIGQVARIAYLCCVVMLLSEASEDRDSEWPHWLVEIAREWMGRGGSGELPHRN